MQNPHEVTRHFEAAIAEYCGSPYAVALDNCSNAIFLALMYEGISGQEIAIPKHTYPAVPCEIIHAGGKVKFEDSPPMLTGSYPLGKTSVWDCALEFTADMYLPETLMCVSFTGPYKHLKLGKGGAILTDSETAYKWFKKARFSGRSECSYHVDNFDDNPVMGWNFYMPVQIAAMGLHMMQQFYNIDGSKKKNADLSLPYPDLSKFELWK